MENSDFITTGTNAQSVSVSLAPGQYITTIQGDGPSIFRSKDSIVSRISGDPVFTLPDIMHIKEIVPQKVVEVTFKDGKKTKAVCSEEDTFSLETAIAICILKRIYGGTKEYNKIIKQGLKVYNNDLKAQKQKEDEAERIKKRRAKRLAKKAKKKADRIEQQIEIQKEAYVRAINEIEATKALESDADTSEE